MSGVDVEMQIDFHTGVADPLSFTSRLLRKAWRSGARVAVFALSPWLARLDQSMWTDDALGFVPHARVPSGTPGPGMERTPIWLCAPDQSAPAGCTVAVNVAIDDVQRYAAFERVIEIVSTDDADVQAARRRWRDWRDRGATIELHRHDQPADDPSTQA
jgi:DNA polymerase III subunit chi